MKEHTPAKAIKAGRALAGQTQADLARALEEATGEHWTSIMVTKLERGDRKLTVDLLLTIAQIQELPIEFYLYGPAATVTNRGPDRANPGSLDPAAAAVSVAA